MGTPKDLVSASALAAELKCTPQNVNASIRRYAVRRYADGRVSRSQFDAAKARLADPKQTEKSAKAWSKPVTGEPLRVAGKGGEKTAAEAQRVRAWIGAERERIALEKERKSLIQAADVEAEWAATCTMIRDAMLGLPTKLCSRLASMTDEPEITKYLRTEIRAELVKLSRQLDE